MLKFYRIVYIYFIYRLNLLYRRNFRKKSCLCFVQLLVVYMISCIQACMTSSISFYSLWKILPINIDIKIIRVYIHECIKIQFRCFCMFASMLHLIHLYVHIYICMYMRITIVVSTGNNLTLLFFILWVDFTFCS